MKASERKVIASGWSEDDGRKGEKAGCELCSACSLVGSAAVPLELLEPLTSNSA